MSYLIINEFDSPLYYQIIVRLQSLSFVNKFLGINFVNTISAHVGKTHMRMRNCKLEFHPLGII